MERQHWSYPVREPSLCAQVKTMAAVQPYKIKQRHHGGGGKGGSISFESHPIWASWAPMKEESPGF